MTIALISVLASLVAIIGGVLVDYRARLSNAEVTISVLRKIIDKDRKRCDAIEESHKDLEYRYEHLLRQLAKQGFDVSEVGSLVPPPEAA